MWTGSLAIDWTNLEPTKLGVTLRATGTGSWSAVTGISNPFDVTVALRSPPTAALTATPVVIRTNQSVSFDASGSSDYQTPAGSLQVSWDFQGTSTAAPAYPAPAAPWTAWTTTKTASNTYTVAGTYLARVAVRDADGDLGFASVTVVVLDPSATLCTVTTSADVDDGATSCAGPYGTDGKLSLAEAIRVAPTNATITFSAPMTITGTGFGTAADNTIVAFNGTSAAIGGTTNTQLVVTVPTGATTGQIAVTVNGLTAFSPSPFTVN